MNTARTAARAAPLLGVLGAACCRATPAPTGQQPTTVVVGSSVAAPRPTSAAPAIPARRAPMKTFDATVRIDDAPAGKRFPFQGAWLVDDDGQRWLAADSPEPWLEPFADRRVRVIGQREQPPEAPDKAPRVRIESLRLATEQPDPSASLVEVKAERTYRGRFERHVWEPGTKLAGEASTVFVSDEGRQFWLANAVEPGPKPGAPVTVRGREVEPSPYVSRPGGAYLWIIAVSP